MLRSYPSRASHPTFSSLQVHTPVPIPIISCSSSERDRQPRACHNCPGTKLPNCYRVLWGGWRSSQWDSKNRQIDKYDWGLCWQSKTMNQPGTTLVQSPKRCRVNDQSPAACPIQILLLCQMSDSSYFVQSENSKLVSSHSSFFKQLTQYSKFR